MILTHLDFSDFLDAILFVAQNPNTGGGGNANVTIDTACVAEHWNLATVAIKALFIHGTLAFLTGIVYRL